MVKWTSQYDVKLNGKGYMLLKGGSGGFQQGAAQDRRTNPWTRTVSEEGRHAKQSFKFGGGAGAHEYSDDDRYEDGQNIDTRSGYLQMAPKFWGYPREASTPFDELTYVGEYITEPWPRFMTIEPGDQGAVQLYDVPSGTSIRCVGLCLSTDGPGDIDWTKVTVQLYSNHASGDYPDAGGAVATVQDGVPPGAFAPWEHYGHDDLGVWYEFLFSSNQTLGDDQWIVVENSAGATYDLHWYYAMPLPDSNGYPTGRKYAKHDGVSWTGYDPNYVGDDDANAPLGSTDPRRFPAVKTRPATGIDGIVRKVLEFGSYYGDRTVVIAGNKVFNYDHDLDTLSDVSPSGGFDYVIWDAEVWYWGNRLGSNITNVKPMLYVTFKNRDPGGTETPYYVQTWNGQLGQTGWGTAAAEVTDAMEDTAHVLGKARGMFWKGEDSYITPTLNLGNADRFWNPDKAYGVGNPNTPVLKIAEGPEGAVLVLKPEGVYSIYVPDGYLTTTGATLRDDLLLDLAGEECGRGWIETMGSSVYFPLAHGMGEYSSGYFRDTWVERKGDAGLYEQIDSWDPWFGRFVSASPLPRSFWLAKGTPGIDGRWRDDLSWSTSPPARSNPLQIWSWDGRGFHPMVSETRYYGEHCMTLRQVQAGGGYANVIYGHGFHLRRFPIPNWTEDRAQGDPAQYINSYYPMKESDWPHVILPVFYGSDMSENKHWVGVEVNYEQMSDNPTYYVLFKVFVRRYRGEDWAECPITDSSMAFTDPSDATRTGWSGGSLKFAMPNDTDSRWCQLKVQFYPVNTVANISEASNIKVGSVTLIYDEQPEPVIHHDLVIAAADYSQLHHSGRGRTALTIVEELEALVDDANEIEYVDPFGRAHTVRPMGLTQEPVKTEKGHGDTGTGLQVETIVAISLLDTEWP